VDIDAIKVIALDLDGTLTQHKSKLDERNRGVLDLLSRSHHLLMVGAGMCVRIFEQMDRYAIDIIGNYGLQYCKYNADTQAIQSVYNLTLPCDRDMVTEKITALRKVLGYEQFIGAAVEFHDSGCVTFPLLGTDAPLNEKLSFDPDRILRRRMYKKVTAAFPEYRVFVGGSSSFDMAPAPYDKYYALDAYCRSEGLRHKNVLYVGDDYGMGGNDETVYRSDFPFIPIDDYHCFPDVMAAFLTTSRQL